MSDLFSAIECAWNDLVRSPHGSDVHRRWMSSEPVLCCVSGLAELVRVAQGRDADDLEWRDRVQRAILRLAQKDSEAQLAMLQVLRPGLMDLARRYSPFWGRSDAEAMVVEITLERFKAGPQRPARPAASIVHGVRNRLWRLRQLQTSQAGLVDGRARRGDIDIEVAPAPVSASDAVLQLVIQALRCGHISERGARLILLQRLYDVPTQVLAAQEGRDVRAIRKFRNRAERALGVEVEVVA